MGEARARRAEPGAAAGAGAGAGAHRTPDDVLTAYRQALDANPDDPMAQYLYGLVCLETGQLEAAATALAAARAGGVDAADRELGRLALRQRDLDGARAS